ncbi:MAG TPA: hypothetical protein VGB54_13680 [Allosphingosinicella sp.]
MMRLPRPASPRTLWRDIRALLGQRSSHQWIAALLAITIPAIIVTTFMFDSKDAHDAPEQIIYVESWRADRSIDETRARIAADEVRRKEFEEQRRRSFQKVDEAFNKLGI